MRIPDPHGAWRSHPDEPRLLTRRRPDEPGGDGCYRLLREGWLRDHDGFTIPTPRTQEGLDLNRNFPAGWGQEVPGPGDYPGSEPEILALMAAVVARPNVCGYNAYHTSGGVLLRPSSTRPDRELPPVDVRTWTQLGRAVHRAHHLPGALRLRGLHVGPVEGDVRRGRRLGLRAPRRLQLDHRVLGRHRRGHRTSAPTPTSGSPGRRRSRSWPSSAGPTSTTPVRCSSSGIRSTTRSSARSSSGGWDWMLSWTNPPPAGCRPRSRRTPSSPSSRRSPRRPSRCCWPTPSRSGRARGGCGPASPTPAGCRRR